MRTARLLAGVRRFVRDRLTVAGAAKEIRRGLDRREHNFLEVLRTQVFERPESPYQTLLHLAGATFGDLEHSVRQHGVDGALLRLAEAGVYLTADEFKGKKEVVRGGTSFRVAPELFLRPGPASGFIGISSGTRNEPVSTFIPLDWLAVRTAAAGLFYASHDLYSRAHALCDGILPAAPGTNNLLILGKLGIPVARWFSHRISVHSRAERSYYYLLTQLIILTGRLSGARFPWPQFIQLPDLRWIVHWVQEEHRRGIACCITTAASNAARIARTAEEMGVSLEGTTFIAIGEPYTESKREVIERLGARAASRYAYGGGVNIGFGCADRRYTDDVHVNEHFLALLAHPSPLPGDGPPIHPLLCTTLTPLAPRMLLNVASGDYALLERRECGCALGAAGLNLHVHRIRSFEKFTSEGLNYFYGDLFELFEQTLPGEFGGGPGDYQLVEEEDEKGQTRLTLLVHPSVGGVDETRLISRVFASLSAGSRGNQFMARVWQGAGTVRVRRQAPHASPRGKILPLHLPH
ncbi:MAG TPA: hypothetical protein VGR25_10300 [bacterium]|nr:hypothetical protein [bacterium]